MPGLRDTEVRYSLRILYARIGAHHDDAFSGLTSLLQVRGGLRFRCPLVHPELDRMKPGVQAALGE